ncbi:MAG: AraC family transcriptional regulator [Maribacter sp.]|uniref:AraC family transcriptional regulator n=1 Tax=Maribacter sp. TaxID=1897614 RepID=UPI003C71D2C5
MKLTYRQIERKPENAFLARRDTMLCIEDNWHFHKELELIYFVKGQGTRYVGNSIGNFSKGEIYLIGSNLPHLFRNDKEYYQNNAASEAVDLIIVQFESDFMGEQFSSLTVSDKLQHLFKMANRGIKFSDETCSLVKKNLKNLINGKGLSRLIDLLKVLDTLSLSEGYEFLCPEGVNNTFKKNEKDRMAKLISFLTENFEKKIELEEVASIAHMTPNAFCRYFKRRTQKSFTQYLNEIRIDNACKLLIEGKLPISTICYLSGYNTLTNFNRQFKSIMNITPTDYMKKYEVEV